MKSVKFNDSELEFLINHYELELIDAENYIAELKNILKKLGAIEKKPADIPLSVAAKKTKKGKKGKPGRPRKIQPDSSATPIKKEKPKGKPGRPKKNVTLVIAPVPEKKEAAQKPEVKVKKTRTKKTIKNSTPGKKISRGKAKGKPAAPPVPVAEPSKTE